MNDKEIYDSIMKLVDFQIGQFNVRRQLEWKMLLAVWAIIVATTAFIMEKKLTVVQEYLAWSVVSAILVAILTFLHIFAIWRNNLLDRDAAYHYRRQAVNVLVGQKSEKFEVFSPPVHRFWYKYFCFLTSPYHFVQSLVTIVLLVIALLLMSHVTT